MLTNDNQGHREDDFLTVPRCWESARKIVGEHKKLVQIVCFDSRNVIRALFNKSFMRLCFSASEDSNGILVLRSKTATAAQSKPSLTDIAEIWSSVTKPCSMQAAHWSVDACVCLSNFQPLAKCYTQIPKIWQYNQNCLINTETLMNPSIINKKAISLS